MKTLPPIPVDQPRRFWDARFADPNFVYGEELAAYTPRQLELGTGGPPLLELLMLEERRRSIAEGPYHRGESAVVQSVGRKPVGMAATAPH